MRDATNSLSTASGDATEASTLRNGYGGLWVWGWSGEYGYSRVSGYKLWDRECQTYDVTLEIIIMSMYNAMIISIIDCHYSSMISGMKWV